MDSIGELLTHRTIRLALACIVGAFAIRIANRQHWGRDTSMSRGLWTLGCAFFVAHVACAFQFYHHWSHQHAFLVTAQRTQEQIGIAFGPGIYFSYFFTLLWIVEVVVMWTWPDAFDARPSWLYWAVSGFMAFIAFNGAVVFEDGITRPLGIIATLGLASLGYHAWRERQNPIPAVANDLASNSPTPQVAATDSPATEELATGTSATESSANSL
jgi:hypothetical protein